VALTRSHDGSVVLNELGGIAPAESAAVYRTRRHADTWVMAAGDFVPFSTDAETFELDSYLDAALPKAEYVLYPDFRIALTRNNPLLFAWIYMKHRLISEDTGDAVTFSDFHLAMYHWAAVEWTQPLGEPKKFRDLWLGPRNIGKSTTLEIEMLWALCHGWAKFVAIFSGSERQARFLISSLTEELKNNPLLRKDYPSVAKAYGKLPAELRELEEDRVDFYRSRSGAVIISLSATASVAGMRVGGKRPDLMILDDIEQTGESYSASQAESRLTTVLQSILPLRRTARVILTGTAQMVGSIMHTAVASVDGTEQAETGIVHSKPVNVPDDAKWLEEMNLTLHWYRPLVSRPNGSRRSVWQEMWDTNMLLEIENTREYAETYDNKPWVSHGILFSRDTYRYDLLASASIAVLSLDPARTSKAGSDFAGISIVRYSKIKDVFQVVYAEQSRLNGKALRARILGLLDGYLTEYPDEQINTILVETNVGTDMADIDNGILHDLPVRVEPVHWGGRGEYRVYGDKDARMERASQEYYHGRVLHKRGAPGISLLEQTQMAYPKVAHDDISDSVVNALLVIRHNMRKELAARRKAPTVQRVSYGR
jgi:hypothetical protein